MDVKLYKAEMYLTEEEVKLLKELNKEMNGYLELENKTPDWTFKDTLNSCLRKGIKSEIERIKQK